MIRQCPYLLKNKYTEASGKNGNESINNNRMSHIVLQRNSLNMTVIKIVNQGMILVAS